MNETLISSIALLGSISFILGIAGVYIDKILKPKLTIVDTTTKPLEDLSKVAFIKCGGDCNVSKNIFEYDGIETCKGAEFLFEGNKACNFGCLALGDCIRACPDNAIAKNSKGLPVVDRSKCTTCGICIDVCPKNLIEMVPKTSMVLVACNSPDFPEVTETNCSVGCNTCNICEDICPFDAVHITNNLAKIDYEKCTNCGVCAFRCPSHTIVDMIKARPKVYINPACDGCGVCAEVCPLDAVEGIKDSKHKIITESCNGCGICVDKCHVNAINVIGALGFHSKAA
jgi:Pyruvate/2-oxoacid:ferredoxin oxidoreductase delta subunit